MWLMSYRSFFVQEDVANELGNVSSHIGSTKSGIVNITKSVLLDNYKGKFRVMFSVLTTVSAHVPSRKQ